MGIKLQTEDCPTCRNKKNNVFCTIGDCHDGKVPRNMMSIVLFQQIMKKFTASKKTPSSPKSNSSEKSEPEAKTPTWTEQLAEGWGKVKNNFQEYVGGICAPTPETCPLCHEEKTSRSKKSKKVSPPCKDTIYIIS